MQLKIHKYIRGNTNNKKGPEKSSKEKVELPGWDSGHNRAALRKPNYQYDFTERCKHDGTL